MSASDSAFCVVLGLMMGVIAGVCAAGLTVLTLPSRLMNPSLWAGVGVVAFLIGTWRGFRYCREGFEPARDVRVRASRAA